MTAGGGGIQTSSASQPGLIWTWKSDALHHLFVVGSLSLSLRRIGKVSALEWTESKTKMLRWHLGGTVIVLFDGDSCIVLLPPTATAQMGCDWHLPPEHVEGPLEGHRHKNRLL